MNGSIDNENYSHSHGQYKKGNMQHKIFKLIILIIVGVFLYLIFSFIKIEFFSKSNIDYNFEMYQEKYNYLENIDKQFYVQGGALQECNLKDFYSEHISNYRPCVVGKNMESLQYLDKLKLFISEIKRKDGYTNIRGAEAKIGFMDFFKYLEFIDIYMTTDNTDLNPKLINKDLVIIVVEGGIEIALSPITQINKLKPLRSAEIDERTSIFNPITCNQDLFQAYDEKNNMSPIVFKSNLNEGDIVYIPSYFFKQIHRRNVGHTYTDTDANNSALVTFEFLSSSRILNTIYKVLFDDNIKSDDDM